MALVFKGDGVRVYQALAVARGLDFYAEHKMRINKAYTPKNMLATASAITGKSFKRNQLREAAAALRAFANTVAGNV